MTKLLNLLGLVMVGAVTIDKRTRQLDESENTIDIASEPVHFSFDDGAR